MNSGFRLKLRSCPKPNVIQESLITEYLERSCFNPALQRTMKDWIIGAWDTEKHRRGFIKSLLGPTCLRQYASLTYGQPMVMDEEGLLRPGYYKPPFQLDLIREVQLRKLIEKKYNVYLPNYRSFHRWSCDNYAQFWEEVLNFCNVKLGNPYTEVIDTSKGISEFPRWFSGARLNYAENILSNGKDDDVAIISAKLNMSLKFHSYKELRRDVQLLGTWLRSMDVMPGDRVCGFMPNTYECAVAMFATTAIGAVWSSASCDFGHKGVLDRFQQIKPKILFSVEAVTYKGKVLPMNDKLDAIVWELKPEKVILVNNLKTSEKIDFSEFAHKELYSDFYQCINSTAEPSGAFYYEQLPFSHPLFIMFSSGTTGIPKGIVHTAGGVLLKHVEEHMIQGNSRSRDRLLFYTTCGWMMWNWLLSFLYCGGSIVLFDECPLIPDCDILFKIAARTNTTMIGMGARLYDEFMSYGKNFAVSYDLSEIHTVYSTGSALSAATFEYINNNIAPRANIGSISGGTDILGCFMGSSPTVPVVPGQCSCLFLGMDVHSYDVNGQSVLGKDGELVCLRPFPSMPSHFLGDPKFAKYKKAYFERFPGIWSHGDFCEISKTTGGITMRGRSDTTLNRGGVRIGTAEIYSVVDSFDDIEDSVVVGKWDNKKKDEIIYLFVKMRGKNDFVEDIAKKLKTAIREMMSPRHIPDFIYSIEDIPYTHSGKKAEMAVKQILNSQRVANTSSLRNPESLDQYKLFQA